MNRNITLLIGFILAFVAFILFWLDNSKAIRYQAYNDCANISKYEVKDGNATVSYPVEDVYQKCLELIK